MNKSKEPRLTVIVVSDFEAGAKDWRDEIKMAQALAVQTINETFDVVFVENTRAGISEPPLEIQSLLPGATFLYGDSDQSAILKNLGVEKCNTPLVAVLEADAAPDPVWLETLVTASDTYAEYDVFTGRTHYGDETIWRRVLNMLDRTYDDLGTSGRTVHISNNGALFRTSVIKNFPYPHGPTPFYSPRFRSAAMLEAGHKFYFVHSALMRHAIGGIDFVIDYRRNHGFANYAAYKKQTLATVLRTIIASMKDDAKNIARLHKSYWRWRDWPLGLFMYFLVRLPEAAGAVEAWRRPSGLAHTAYR